MDVGFIFRLPLLILVPYSGYNQGTAGVRLPAGLLIFGLRCGFGRRYRKPFSLLADMLNASNDFVGRMPLGFQPFDQSGDFLTGTQVAFQYLILGRGRAFTHYHARSLINIKTFEEGC